MTALKCQFCCTSAAVNLSIIELKEEEDFSLAFLFHNENVFSLHLVPMCCDVLTLVLVPFNCGITQVLFMQIPVL